MMFTLNEKLKPCILDVFCNFFCTYFLKLMASLETLEWGQQTGHRGLRAFKSHHHVLTVRSDRTTVNPAVVFSCENTLIRLWVTFAVRPRAAERDSGKSRGGKTLTITLESSAIILAHWLKRSQAAALQPSQNNPVHLPSEGERNTVCMCVSACARVC